MLQASKKLLQFVGRGRAATTAEGKAREPGARGAREASIATAADVPVSRYDALTPDEVLVHLSDLTPAALAKLRDHEHTHQNRAPVLAAIDARLHTEPWPGYDTMDVDAVRGGLDGAGAEQLAAVLAYERAHQNRAGVLLATQQHS
jgi:hypothetical protein